MIRTPLALALFALLAACTPERASTDAAPVADTPPVDQPAQDVPPATAPTTDTGAAGQPASDPQTGAAPDGDLGLARFDGYGDMTFGLAANEMENAWGGELNRLGAEGDTCYFMTPKWVKAPAELAFMVEDGKFVRVGTENAKLAAPGGGKIGMTIAQIEALYPGRVQQQPHKYTDGKYLRIKDTASNNALVFETDAAGKVTEWRVGMPPQVDYVEGCS